MDLTEIFFEVIYPIFPLFHRPSLTRCVSRGEHLTDRPLFASVAAICALSSARARDGAVYSTTWDLESLKQPTSEEFLAAAIDAIPKDAALTQGFDYMRTRVLLAVTCIQYGRMTESQYHLSQYHSFVAVASLHDENEWPRDLGPIEIEERRRLFWSAYTLDVFTSVIGKGVVRGSEAAFNVCYPTEADDEDIGGAGMNPSRSHSAPHDTTWMRGWNFVTDLYRILEHTLYGFRRLRSKDHRTPLIPVTFFDCPVSQNAVLDHVMTMYQELPASLKATKPVTNCWAENLLSFQAANIAATVQLVRMVLFTTEGSNVEQKCRIASDLVRTFASVPTAYLRAISSPLLHHLTGIGMVLGSAFHDGLTQSSYGNIRTVLLELAELISHLETGLQYSAGTSDKLRTQVESIDEFWRMQEQTKASFGLDTTVDAEGTGIRPTGPGQDDQAHSGQLNEDSPHFHFPTELLENWTWVFDCT